MFRPSSSGEARKEAHSSRVARVPPNNALSPGTVSFSFTAALMRHLRTSAQYYARAVCALGTCRAARCLSNAGVMAMRCGFGTAGVIIFCELEFVLYYKL